MKLHIFNPEHDMALAANIHRFTAPHAGRQMRADLGFLPVLWAEDGDMVLVDDVEASLESVRHIARYASDVAFVSACDLKNIPAEMLGAMQVEPWGWNINVAEQLVRANPLFASVVPSAKVLESIRSLSNRRFAAERLLPNLCETDGRLVGRSLYCTNEAEAMEAMSRNGRSVLKSPWSSSGRGVRYVLDVMPEPQLVGWMRNVMRQQGGIMVEPFYCCVCDFGMEFMACQDSNVDYCGLSLFATRGGAYTGSVCATESDKRDMLSRYVNMELLDDVRRNIQSILAPLLRGVYTGPFGVDMMAVGDGDGAMMLHPCVELNLRRTMGHVALALTPSPAEPRRLMNVYYAGKYRLRIKHTAENLLNTGLC